MITKKAVITNNDKVCDKYSGNAEVHFMEDASAHEIFAKAMEFVKDGGRLVNHNIGNVKGFYRSVCIFYGDENAPIKRDLDEMTKAIADTENVETKVPAFKFMAQLADLNRCGMSTNKIN